MGKITKFLILLLLITVFTVIITVFTLPIIKDYGDSMYLAGIEDGMKLTYVKGMRDGYKEAMRDCAEKGGLVWIQQ